LPVLAKGEYLDMLGTTRHISAGGHPTRLLTHPDLRRLRLSACDYRSIMLIGVLLLAGCGGGSGESAGPAPGPSAQEMTDARNAALSSNFDVSANQVKLRAGQSLPGREAKRGRLLVRH
jgi:hypothetical protein